MARKKKMPESEGKLPEKPAEMPVDDEEMLENDLPEDREPERIEAGTDLTEKQLVTLKERANKILKKAREKGDEQALLFETIFQQYLETLDHRQKLRKALVDDGVTVTKEYVKGRQNIYVHPALAAYATQGKLLLETAKTLMTLIREKIADEDDEDEFDLFLSGR